MIAQGMATAIEMVDKSFGYWTVISRGPNDARHQARWNCVCVCGKTSLVRGADLRSYSSTSCGCSRALAQKRTGPQHPNWKTGKYKDANGYIRLSFPGGKSQLEHRAVMEKTLGRVLLPEETIHHKNGIRDDNRSENLELFNSRHPRGQRVDELIADAVATLRRYAPEKLSESA